MQNVSGRDKAYAYVRDVVLTSPSAAGAFLNEQELATQIGVSRTPVREALLMLQAEGLVELVPKRGAHVPAMSGRQLRELMDLRGALERHAASTTLRSSTAPVEKMRAILDEQKALMNSADPASAKEFIDIDGRFHQALIDAAGSELLSASYARLRTRQLRAGLTALSTTPDRQDAVCHEHEAIVDALALGDESAVHHAIDDHLQITLQALLLG